jgi:hypothetical protein
MEYLCPEMARLMSNRWMMRWGVNVVVLQSDRLVGIVETPTAEDLLKADV